MKGKNGRQDIKLTPDNTENKSKFTKLYFEI
jgi:hypothetical protein